MIMKAKGVIYLCVSLKGRDMGSDDRIKRLKNYAYNNGIEILKVFVDALPNGDNFREMLDYIASPSFSVSIVAESNKQIFYDMRDVELLHVFNCSVYLVMDHLFIPSNGWINGMFPPVIKRRLIINEYDRLASNTDSFTILVRPGKGNFPEIPKGEKLN